MPVLSRKTKVIIGTIIALVIWFFAFAGSVASVNAQETLWVYDETDHLTEDSLNEISNLNENVYQGYEIQPEVAVEILYDFPDGYSDIDEYRFDRFNELGVGSALSSSSSSSIVGLSGLVSHYGSPDCL